jgi:hypothetical protein
MFRCPYCGTQMAHPEPEHLPMSFKRRAVYDYIAKAGPKGVKKEEMIEKFFAACGSETILRTTIHYINKVIKPKRINSRGGIIRLMVNDN